jgi:ATP-dependent Clp protease adaptor protein ClpS
MSGGILRRLTYLEAGYRDQTMTDTITRPREKNEQQTKGLPPYNVILLDDDVHSFWYVIYMLKTLFGHPLKKGYRMALEVHTTGRAIVATTNLEQAEVKREQIHAFGPDPLIPRCKGSMRASIEPAPG